MVCQIEMQYDIGSTIANLSKTILQPKSLNQSPGHIGNKTKSENAMNETEAPNTNIA